MNQALRALLSMLTQAQAAAILRESGFLGSDEELTGKEISFEEMRLSGGRALFSYKTRYFDQTEGEMMSGRFYIILSDDGNLRADY